MALVSVEVSEALAWQALLAAETTPSKSLVLARELGSSRVFDARRVAEHPLLSEAERANEELDVRCERRIETNRGAESENV